ncbi:AAA family ATPase [Brevibacillus daliensis]|uniref:AAA family ATPase n=1 Tax=Brevibacillus daliensis TaxID=2892995 RepID=UPI001E636F75|nr:MoxR family ATPase [Brevibacillus daliensis]
MHVEKIQKLLNTINSVIVGKEEQVQLVVAGMLARGHILLEDLPGMGKTVLARTLSQAIGGEFNRLQFTADLLPSDVVGLHYFNPKLSEFELRKGPVFADVLLADEINRATPRTQSGLLECMEERQATIEGISLSLSPQFFVIATQNPIESEGTYPLPEAQLDRFLFRISLGYGTREDSLAMMRRFRIDSPLDKIEPVLQLEDLATMQEEVRHIHVSEAVEQYIIDLTEASRHHASVEIGISPRAMLALVRASQAIAYVQGRNYVLPDDVKKVVPPILTHRIRLTMEAELILTESDVVMEIIQSVPSPVEESVR